MGQLKGSKETSPPPPKKPAPSVEVTEVDGKAAVSKIKMKPPQLRKFLKSNGVDAGQQKRAYSTLFGFRPGRQSHHGLKRGHAYSETSHEAEKKRGGVIILNS